MSLVRVSFFQLVSTRPKKQAIREVSSELGGNARKKFFSPNVLSVCSLLAYASNFSIASKQLPFASAYLRQYLGRYFQVLSWLVACRRFLAACTTLIDNFRTFYNRLKSHEHFYLPLADSFTGRFRNAPQRSCSLFLNAPNNLRGCVHVGLGIFVHGIVSRTFKYVHY